jgi:hypothetical protein
MDANRSAVAKAMARPGREWGIHHEGTKDMMADGRRSCLGVSRLGFGQTEACV